MLPVTTQSFATPYHRLVLPPILVLLLPNAILHQVQMN